MADPRSVNERLKDLNKARAAEKRYKAGMRLHFFGIGVAVTLILLAFGLGILGVSQPGVLVPLGLTGLLGSAVMGWRTNVWWLHHNRNTDVDRHGRRYHEPIPSPNEVVHDAEYDHLQAALKQAEGWNP